MGSWGPRMHQAAITGEDSYNPAQAVSSTPPPNPHTHTHTHTHTHPRTSALHHCVPPLLHCIPPLHHCVPPQTQRSAAIHPDCNLLSIRSEEHTSELQ